jgi:hypothetical protein
MGKAHQNQKKTAQTKSETNALATLTHENEHVSFLKHSQRKKNCK